MRHILLLVSHLTSLSGHFSLLLFFFFFCERALDEAVDIRSVIDYTRTDRKCRSARAGVDYPSAQLGCGCAGCLPAGRLFRLRAAAAGGEWVPAAISVYNGFALKEHNGAAAAATAGRNRIDGDVDAVANVCG